MSPARFELVTCWHLPASPEAIWAQLTHPEDWPQWWRGVVAVLPLECGDAAGLGACYRMSWRGALPYRVEFEMRTVRIERPRLIEGVARGGLEGVGRWTLEPYGAVTAVRYDWRVEAARPWMRALAPILRPLFTWNHGVIMRWGCEGLTRRLAAAGTALR